MIGVIATQVICFSRAKLPCRSSQKHGVVEDFVLCCVVLLAIIFEEGESWGRFRFRAPRIRVPRIRLPRIRLPRIRLPTKPIPRIPIPRIPIPRLPIPRLPIPRLPIPRLSSVISRIRIPCYLQPRLSSGVPLLRSMDRGLSSLPNDFRPPGDDPCSVIIPRSKWGAASIKASKPLEVPLTIVAMYSRGENCTTRVSCTEEAKSVCLIGKNTTGTMFDSFLSLIDCGKSRGMIARNMTEDGYVERP
ncbi:hypothetical protein LSH36_872g01047 [Paralvinella palmiformis]|uniref:Uncharacterized protein n=1 Tax=Paralvinella palmiformis TaxID=53620 RepID=A0AAD9IYX9_9ANNE|nr:hypothetical protein LSH36_872g01047 [Paralvinella palmiformis]